MDETLRQSALHYHREPRPGKLTIEPTKRMETQRDLALAYSPGVAAPCLEIAADPDKARDYTARGNLVAVITNGTAVLGLGNIGALASKPVMEGKAVLFKKFAGIDVFDIEVDASDPDKFVEVVAALEPTFGAINLEDIKAPECFEIEAKLRERMNIPVFHDDQHGTAIVCAAAVRNGLLLQGKKLSEVKLVTSGAGAAALTCVRLLITMGLPIENVTLTDIKGVVHAGREGLTPELEPFARHTDARTLGEVLAGADLFLGLSAPRVLKEEWLPLLADKPLILALANPEPEVLPEIVRRVRPDAIIATGRSDYANQVNNVLCFPYIFRGALDCGATTINSEMELAAVEAIAELARIEPDESVARAYGGAQMLFGPEYIIPKPFDPRLALLVAPAVARAAMATGIARHPIEDFVAYAQQLQRFAYRSGQLMHPVFERARQTLKRIAYAEGEDERVLRAAQVVIDERIARPVLIARREMVAQRIAKLGLRMTEGQDYEILDPIADEETIPHLEDAYSKLVERRGVTPGAGRYRIRRRPAITAAMLLREGLVDGALCGGTADWWMQTGDILPIIPRLPGLKRVYALSALIVGDQTLFFCDTHMNVDPTAQEVAEMTLLAADAVRGFGITPRAALLSHSNFGASNSPSAKKMRQALRLVRDDAPELEIDGEMHADAALVPAIRDILVSSSSLKGGANLLVMPNLDAANIAFTLLAAATDALAVGPMLLGMSKPVHVLTASVTARGIVNMTALTAAAETTLGAR
ncbi:NADP-dependent malic enzyme [Sphingomonas abietis]|uniref:NADP-dependent malic enzyme n=1 Tax=Sphingomonas abietis TaxID=3012344 RepID=A0ABY7NTP3_9SPHN|nr:NADP-dependent malic enzyme [Sphingomonas abietis]WBO24028.1 NADP-dependent malic enzyme [Sphingomonas abietis]